MMLPSMTRVRQRMSGQALRDLAGAIRGALSSLSLPLRPGMQVGVPVGSRGIRQIPLLIREIVTHLQTHGAEPVVMAAMGSHGGGTASGQLSVLRDLGITEQALGVPVMAGVDVTEIGQTLDGKPVYFDATLARCDGLLVLNRVKPHTSFRGRLESGLTKMLVVGCGKPAGARQFHQFPAAQLSSRLEEMGRIILDRLSVLGGIAVLENGREEIAAIEPVSSSRFMEREMELLDHARTLLPSLPVRDLDLLVVDQMGKDISGTGMDTNIIGRTGVPGLDSPGPQVRRLVVLDLTNGSHGNANGMGLADLTTRRLANKVDFQATYLNTLTATFVERAKLPIVVESDREVIETALRTIGDPTAPRIIRIKSTLEIEEMLVSPAVLAELQGQVDIVESAAPWQFDGNGDLF